jgi:CRISPR/Cas system-associated protein Cas5 (RAMP superfamily)
MDKINPTHYKGTIECIDAIESTMTKEAYRGYLKGNVLKYMWRYEKKNGVEDLEKAEWYLKRLIESL